MFVACSTVCFTQYPLDRALRLIGELEFNKLDVAIDERGPHLKPSEVVADVALAGQRIRIGPSLTPAAFNVEIEAGNFEDYRKQLKAICHLARNSHVSLITIPAAPNTANVEEEVRRLEGLVHFAETEGIVLTVETRMGTLTEIPDQAVELCRRVPGLGLTLDPSHYISGPHRGTNFDQVYPFVRHVHLRDSGREAGRFQVRVGQGEIEYGRIIAQLARHHYNRLLTVETYDVPDSPYVMEQEVRKLKYLLESLI
ncbi:MAG TPA: sugar phosphate isomerase/epimerase [Gemmataceae bacterium]|nr:sugar phosphate isomerase/epimerase [Gemmataceae bacterium]